MASGAKTALMLALMVAMAVAVQATSHKVSCTNKYCKPIKCNGVVIGVGATVSVLVDNVLQTLTCVVPDILGAVHTLTCGCPSVVSAVTILEVGLGLGVEVNAALSILGSILGNLTLDLAICL